MGSLCGAGGREIAWEVMRRRLRRGSRSAPQQVRGGHDDPDEKAERRCVAGMADERPVRSTLDDADAEDGEAAGDPGLSEALVDLARTERCERGADDHSGGRGGGRAGETG